MDQLTDLDSRADHTGDSLGMISGAIEPPGISFVRVMTKPLSHSPSQR